MIKVWKMWKQAQALFAEEEYDDSQENLLEEAEGLCSLSPTQVLITLLNRPNSRQSFQ